MVHRLRPTLAAVLAAALLTGCSNTPEDPDEEIPAEVDEVLGRDRPDYEGKGTLEQIFSGGGEGLSEEQVAAAQEASRQLQRLELRVARLEQQLASSPQQAGASDSASQGADALVMGAGPTPELALWQANDVDDGLVRRLGRAFARAAGDAGVPFSTADAVAERLTEVGCNAPSDPGCLAELAVYPGTRVLIAVESATVREGAAVVTYRLMDTVLGVERNAKTLRMAAPDGRLPQAALTAAVDEMLISAGTLLERAPWQTRAFNREGDQWYLNTGRRAGLNVGDTLIVHAPGRTISTPGGNVAGWVPGPRKGRLEVTGFAGDDIAVARLVDGQPPTPTDPILTANDQRRAAE